MQARLSQADQAFQAEVRDFISTHLDPAVSRRVKLGYTAGKDQTDAWTRTLNQRGWAAPNWPVAVGGTGWSMIRRHIF
jgi:alkylation response protein AidB-like acyl-CoA dehydrogenase